MLTFKHFILFLTVCFSLGCKGPHYAFKSADLSPNLWKRSVEYLSQLDGGNIPINKINKVYVYSATFKEIAVEQNGVSNYQVVNTESESFKAQKLPVIGYWHKIYLLVFSIEPQLKPTPAIYFSTSYNKSGRCIGIDPIYIGELNDQKVENDVFLTRRYLKIKEEGNHFTFARTKKDSVDLRFEADNPLMPLNDGVGQVVRFTELRQGYENTITGKEKKIIYLPNQIFNDDNALLFKLEKILTSSN